MDISNKTNLTLSTVISFPLIRLILIAEKNTVYDNFPTPLINCLEKHFVLTSSVLEDWQQEVLQTFHQWILKFSNTRYVYIVTLDPHHEHNCSALASTFDRSYLKSMTIN